MIPRTKGKLSPFACLSAMQKAIRRGLEAEAMEFACELGLTSKAFFTMVCNRLEIVAHEDVGLADQQAVIFASLAIDQAKRHYNPEKPGLWRMPLGNAIRALSRAQKSREGDHFQAAIGLRAQLTDYTPTVPDWAFDMHTVEGRRRGRGLDHFRTEGARLHPPAESDEYEEQAYEMWKIRDAHKNGHKPSEELLFDAP
jgi:replication-associated recombination protein RarA